MKRVRTAAALGAAAVLLCASGCQDRDEPPAPLARVTDAAALGLPPAISVDAAFRLPAGLRVAHYGAHTDGARVVFGVEPPAVGGGPAGPSHPGVQPSGTPGRYAVVALADGTLTLRDAGQAGTLTDYLTMLPGAHLVRVEPVELPPTACPDIPVTCYRWRITDEILPGGAPRVVATGDRPAAANQVPQPVTAGDRAVWTVVDGRGAQVWSYRPGEAARPVGAPVPPGILSVADGAAWIGTPPGETVVYRIPLDGAAPSRIALPPTAGLATVTPGHVAFRVDESERSRAVCVADLPDPHACRKVFRAVDIYALYWLDQNTLLLSTPDGYSLVSLDGVATPIPVNYLYLIHSDDGRLVFVEEIDGRQVLVVGHLS